MSLPALPLFDLRMEEEDLEAAASVLRGGRLRAGRRVAMFESAFAELVGAPHAVALSSCTTALHLAYLAAGVGPGDEVIVPSITFAASANAAIYCGATPVMADIVSVRDIGLDPADAERRITPRTKAICAVHFAGYPAAITALQELCDRHGLVLIEDAAHGPLGEVDGRQIGTHGLVGCFSFFSNKVLAVGEGGALVTADPDIAERVRAERDRFGYAFDELRAAILLSRMTRVRADVEARRRLTLRYRSLLAGVDGVICPYEDADVAHSACYVMPIVLEDPSRQGRVREHMRERHGIQTSLLYPALHEFTAYVERFGEQSLPNSERIARSEVTIPLFPFMTEADQDRVVGALEEGLT